MESVSKTTRGQQWDGYLAPEAAAQDLRTHSLAEVMVARQREAMEEMDLE